MFTKVDKMYLLGSGFLMSSNPFQAKRRSLNRENIDMEFIPCSIKSKIHRQYNVRKRNNTYGLQIIIIK